MHPSRQLLSLFAGGVIFWGYKLEYGYSGAEINAVKLVTGVESVAVDYATQTATVEGVIDAELLIQAIEDAGYEAMIKAPSKA